MLSLRLTRTGKAHSPHYRIVVQEKRSKLNGGAIDIIGHYHPDTKDKQLVVNGEKALHWLSKGAQASDTVNNLLVRAGVLDKSKKIARFVQPKAEVAEVVEEKVEAPAAEEAAEVVEVPASEEEMAEMLTEAPEEAETAAAEAEEPATETAE